VPPEEERCLLVATFVCLKVISGGKLNHVWGVEVDWIHIGGRGVWGLRLRLRDPTKSEHLGPILYEPGKGGIQREAGRPGNVEPGEVSNGYQPGGSGFLKTKARSVRRRQGAKSFLMKMTEEGGSKEKERHTIHSFCSTTGVEAQV